MTRADTSSIRHEAEKQTSVVLIGNPNVGKSTIFNHLTGMRQHTGNWPGKTVDIAWGTYCYKGKSYTLVDLPGTYSLLSDSEEERISSEFISSDQVSCTVVVADATCLERNLYLCLQILEMTDQVILCINLMDEAKKAGIDIDLAELERQLGIPVVGTSAGHGEGLQTLCEKIRNMADGFLPTHPTTRQRDERITDENEKTKFFAKRSEEIIKLVVNSGKKPTLSKADGLVFGRWSGVTLLLLLLILIFWLTIKGANYPSKWLQWFFDQTVIVLYKVTGWMPSILQSFLIDGIYATAAAVISVMLPPMAIFFPLFTFLEDLGYLPRAAFLMDHWFHRSGSCGKQLLTMSMGFGCNAAAVVGCRIIASPRERLLAILTNSFVPCNGKFPTLIALSFLLFPDHSFAAVMLLSGIVFLGIIMTIVSTKLLSATVLSGKPSVFYMEIPPFRRPQLKKVLVRSVVDRTLLIMGRAAAVAAPVGGVVWILQHMTINHQPLLLFFSEKLDPIGSLLGLNGTIFLAFLLSLPANELLLPMVIAITGTTTDSYHQLFLEHGWSKTTIICTMLFCLLHWPCSTTCLTIRKETGKWRWVLLSILLPTVIGMIVCFLIRSVHL